MGGNKNSLRVGLIDVDSHNWPNLCLMKISAWHKARGDEVSWWQEGGHYDVVYKSRVFTDIYFKDNIAVNNAGKIICGYDFLTRGCSRGCGFGQSAEQGDVWADNAAAGLFRQWSGGWPASVFWAESWIGLQQEQRKHAQRREQDMER